MSFQRKLLVVALASAMPWMSAHAQSSADLLQQIEALKAQLQALTAKVEALSAQPDTTALVQQVNRIEQKQDLAADTQEKSGFKGITVNGVIEAAYKSNDLDKKHTFNSSSGYGSDEAAMLQITKESQDGEGVDWTLRLLPGAAKLVHEASISIPLNKENRIIGGLIPDFQGYEFSFANANPTLGNQLISHNALFDLAGATNYAGIGMSHTFSNGTYALKWVVGNIDSANDASDNSNAAVTGANANNPAVSNPNANTVGFAARGDWFINEFAYIGLSVAHGGTNRDFDIVAIDGGYTHGDWMFNGQLTAGQQRRAAANGDDAAWTGVSGLVGYKLTPRLNLLARADYLENRKNGGGTYVYNGVTDSTTGLSTASAYGLGPELDSTGAVIDPTVGANLTRITLGTNYQINPNTQWKVEYRLDQSTGYNFTDVDGKFKQTRNMFGTSFVVSF